MFGKLLGAMIGVGVGLAFQSALAAFVLGVAGVFVGHTVDSLYEEPPEDPDELLMADFDQEEEEDDDDDEEAAPEEDEHPLLPSAPLPSPVETEEPTAFIPAACGLFIELARADGDINRDEIGAARDYFEASLGYGPRSLQLVRNALKAAMAQEPKVERWVSTCKQTLDPRGRVKLLDGLYQVALVDGGLKKSERDTLRVVARGLGITEEAHRELTRAYFGDGAEHYELLGISEDATDDEVKAAFRRMAAENHPDRFAHQGADASAAAAERFREVQEAYEELRRIRNF